MKVYFNSQLKKFDNSRLLSEIHLKKHTETANSMYKTDLSKMPNYKYQVSFGAMNSNLENLYKAFGQGKGMPETYNKVLSEMTSAEREPITNVYAHYRAVYAPLEECHSTDDIKKLFPTEFSKIQSALSRKSNNGSFISKVSQWASLFEGENDKFLFPATKDNDLAVYLAKKLFLEAKTKKEIKIDFFKEINREILAEKDIKELMITTRGTEAIPDSIFEQLGLQGKFEANGFRHSLLRSREDYIQKYGSVYLSKRKDAFNKTVEAVTSTTNEAAINLPKRGSANYEKMQYAMFDVWNNSMDLKVAMSEFLTCKKAPVEMLMPDLMSMHTLKIKKDETQIQKNIMQEFWAQHPVLKGEFSNRCKDSFMKIEKAIDSGKFEELKKEIDGQRQKSFLEMKILKESREKEIAEQKRLAEEKIRIENLNNAIKRRIREDVENIRNVIAIPQNEISHTVQYFSKTVKDGKGPEKITVALLCAGLKTILDIAAKESFKKLHEHKEINKETEPHLVEMVKELKSESWSNFPKEFREKLFYEKFDKVTKVLLDAYKRYLLFVCNNSSNSPKLKARRKEMEKIINDLLKDSSTTEKLELESQKQLLKAKAFKIAEIPLQDIEQSYTDYYRKGMNKLSEIEIQQIVNG